MNNIDAYDYPNLNNTNLSNNKNTIPGIASQSTGNLQVSCPDLPAPSIPEEIEQRPLDRTEEFAKALNQKQTLLDISYGLSNADTFKDIGKTIFENLQRYEYCKESGGKMAVYDEERDSFEVVFFTHHAETKIPLVMKCSLKELSYFTKVVIGQNQTLIINDSHSEFALGIDNRLSDVTDKMMIFIPLNHKGKLVGMFSDARIPKNSISHTFITFLEDICRFASIAIGELLQKRRKERLEKEIQEDEIEKKDTELLRSALYKISEKTHTTKDLPELYSVIHKIINEFIYAKNFYIALYDDSTQTLSFPYFVDEYDSNPGSIKIGKGLTSYIIRSGQPLYYKKENASDIIRDKNIEILGSTPVDWYGVPLKTDQKVFGVVVVQSYNSVIRFGKREEEILNYVSQHISIAIEKKLSEQLLSESETRYRAIFDTAGFAMLITNEDLIIIKVNSEFERLTGYSKEEIEGKRSCLDFIHQDEMQKILNFHNLRKLDPNSAPKRYEIKSIGNRKQIKNLIVNISLIPETKMRIISLLDITDFKKVEEQLRKSEERFRTVANFTYDWEYWIGPDKKYIYISPSCERITGYHTDEFYNNQELLEKIVHPEDLELTKNHLNNDLRNEKTCNFDFRIITRSGKERWLNHICQPVYDEKGNFLGRRASNRNITKRKRTLLELQAFLDIAKELHLVKTYEDIGKIIFDNFQRFDFIKYSSGKLAIYDNDDDIYKIVFLRETEKQYAPVEMECKMKDVKYFSKFAIEQGRTLFIEDKQSDFALSIDPRHKDVSNGCMIFIPLYYKNNLVGLFSFARSPKNSMDKGFINFLESICKYVSIAVGELLNEKRRLKEIKQMQEQAALLEIAQDAILVQDMNDRIIFWNPGAKILYGWSAKEVLGMNAIELFYGNYSPKIAEAQKILLVNGDWQGELRQRTKDGKEVVVESRWNLMHDEKGNPISKLIINNDITEKKQIETQFLRAQRMESIGTLASGIAHDLNNVLSPIVMALDLLRQKSNDEKSKMLCDTIESSAQRGSDLVKQMLSFARGHVGERIELQISHLIVEVVKICKETFPKTITINKNIPKDLQMISGDPTQLHQVLLNLCVNARDAMENGGNLMLSASNVFINEDYVKLHIEAKVGKYILVDVSDTGNGIPADIQEKVFEPFFTTKDLGKGTGLGLSTVYSIVKNHGGFVHLESEVGKGTKFKIYFPASENAEIIETIEIKSLNLIGENELILVVDDEKPFLDLVMTILENSNYRVYSAKNGAEAVKIYAQNKENIALVLLDQIMPIMDGPSTTKVLKSINPNIKIIAMSGFTAANVLSGVEETQKFIAKPFKGEKLLEMIKNVLKNN